MNAPYLVTQIRELALDLKAIDLKQVDTQGKSAISDYILICHGTSIAHSQGISDRISFGLKKDGILPYGIEGYETGEWILMDYNTVIIHIFTEENRELFNLEDLYLEYKIESFE